jgi:hypothetical protein
MILRLWSHVCDACDCFCILSLISSLCYDMIGQFFSFLLPFVANNWNRMEMFQIEYHKSFWLSDFFDALTSSIVDGYNFELKVYIEKKNFTFINMTNSSSINRRLYWMLMSTFGSTKTFIDGCSSWILDRFYWFQTFLQFIFSKWRNLKTNSHGRLFGYVWTCCLSSEMDLWWKMTQVQWILLRIFFLVLLN